VAVQGRIAKGARRCAGSEATQPVRARRQVTTRSCVTSSRRGPSAHSDVAALSDTAERDVELAAQQGCRSTTARLSVLPLDLLKVTT
jgi:hypothetical protein